MKNCYIFLLNIALTFLCLVLLIHRYDKLITLFAIIKMKMYNYKMIRIWNQRLKSRSTLKYPFLGKHAIAPEIHACTTKLLVGFLQLSMCLDAKQVLYINLYFCILSCFRISYLWLKLAKYMIHNSNNNLWRILHSMGFNRIWRNPITT